jgi:hypothetical protein
MQPHRIVPGFALSLALLAPACSAIVAPDTTRLGDPSPGRDAGGLDAPRPDAPEADGGPAEDVGGRDTGPGLDGGPLPLDAGTDAGPSPVDAGTDAGRDAGSDAGPTPFDAGRDAGRDAGPPVCVDGTESCIGDLRRVCVGGVIRDEDCAAGGAYCEGGACVPWVCEPGSTACSADFRGVERCDARGTASTTESCGSGFCDPSTGACGTLPSACTSLPAITVGGTARFSLCTVSDGDTYTPVGDCAGGVRANSGDRTYQLRVDTTRTVTFDLRDVDSTTAIDTVVYVRRVCDDAATQLGCDDDVPCLESDITTGCSGGLQVRQSRLTLTLDPGVYYVVADAIEYDVFNCGTVELRVF